MARNEKKRRGFGGPMGWLVAILLLLGVGGTGLFRGGFLNGGGDSNGTGYGTTDSAVVSESGEGISDIVNITVNEDSILWNAEEINLEDLRNRVGESSEDTSYIITDDSAIKATYDSVIEEFNQAQVDYQESEAQ